MSNAAAVLPTAAVINVTRASDGVTVFATSSTDQRRTARLSLIAFGILFLCLPIAARVFSHAWIAMVPAAWISGIPALLAILNYDRIHREFVFHCDRSGLKVSSTGPMGKRERIYPKDELKDVTLNSGPNAGMAGRRFAALIVKHSRGIRGKTFYLQQFSANELAIVADALRSALGMPPQSWQ